MLTPYIGPQEFLDNYPEIDLTRYVPSGTPVYQAISLLSVLRRASNLSDQWCKQLLRATVDTESLSLYPTKFNTLAIWPQNRPIISLTNLQYQYLPEDGWTVIQNLDSSQGLQIYDSYFEYMGDYFYQLSKIIVQYTYINGYPIVDIVGTVAQGSSVITVSENPVGFISGDSYSLYDGLNSENVTIESISGTQITLSSPTIYAHSAGGYTLSGIPEPIKMASGIIASNIISRGINGRISVGDSDFKEQYKTDSIITQDVQTLLLPYQVNR